MVNIICIISVVHQDLMWYMNSQFQSQMNYKCHSYLFGSIKVINDMFRNIQSKYFC